MSFEPFSDEALDPPVRGFLHRPAKRNGDVLVFTHGAGGNAQSPMLVFLAEAFAEKGFTVLRCNLPFRQQRSFGSPRPAEAGRDRQGLENAVASVRKLAKGHLFLGGQSYGGRQATMLCAEKPDLAAGLLLTSYPLHPPGKPDRLRTEHFPKLRIPGLFIEGTSDPFGTIEEVKAALKLIPAKTFLMQVQGVGHDLGFSRKVRLPDLPSKVVEQFEKFFR
jgi:predicted alpha/beta-hydrolase family hydrolase